MLLLSSWKLHTFIYFLLYSGILFAAAAATKSLQLCPTLCDPIDGSPPGSLVPGILQARTLEWVAISFSNAWKWKVKLKLLSHVRLLAIPWTAAHQGPPSMGFSRQEYWSGVRHIVYRLILIAKWVNAFISLGCSWYELKGLRMEELCKLCQTNQIH